MEEVLVKPLVKKKSLGAIKTNYRPVSNLQFISKIEKVTLDQFTLHSIETTYCLVISQPTGSTTVARLV